MLENHRGGQFAAGKHEIADGNFVSCEMLRYSLVDAFVASADQNDTLEFRESPRRFLPEEFTGG